MFRRSVRGPSSGLTTRSAVWTEITSSSSLVCWMPKIAQARDFSQLFVSTHSLEFLRYLQRLNATEVLAGGRTQNLERSWLMVSRSESTSALVPLPKAIKKYATEFSHLFEQIFKAAEVDLGDDEAHRSLYGFGNDLRKFLEIFLYYRFPDRDFDFATLELFLGDTVKAALINRIVNEFSHLIGRVERGGAPVDVPELVSAAQCVLEVLRRDQVQYTSLLRSVGREP